MGNRLFSTINDFGYMPQKVKIIAIVLCITLLFAGKEQPSYKDVALSSQMHEDMLARSEVHLPDSIHFPSMKLNDNQKLTVEFTNSGCFHYHRETVVIVKSRDSYLLSCKRVSNGTETNIISQRLMKPSFIARINNFTNNCKSMVIENLKDPKRGKELSTTVAGITIDNGQDVLYIPMDANLTYSLISQFSE